eukprot:3552486-Amphidinium_carterae.1
MYVICALWHHTAAVLRGGCLHPGAQHQEAGYLSAKRPIESIPTNTPIQITVAAAICSSR